MPSKKPPNPRPKNMPAAIGKWRLAGMAGMVIGQPRALQRVVGSSIFFSSACAFAELFAHQSRPTLPRDPDRFFRGHMPRSTDSAHTRRRPTCCHHALLVGDEAAIRAAAIVAVVLGAPWTVHLSGAGRRKESAAHQGRDEQETISHRSHLNLPNSFLTQRPLHLSRSGPATD